MNKNSVVKKKNTTKILSIIFVVLVIVNLVGFLFLLKDKDDDNSGNINNDISNQNTIEEVSNFEIETKYCKLYYPEVWKDQIELKETEEFGYKVEFYSLIQGKEAKHIFDVCFNSDDGNLLGYLKSDDDIINISIDVMELNFDDNWKQDEIDEVYAMQEEMNYVMDTLSNNANYVVPK